MRASRVPYASLGVLTWSRKHLERRGVLELCDFLTRDFLAQGFWVPNALNAFRHYKTV